MNPKVDAALYLITMLLQRMEKNNPGFIKEIIEGVEADQKSMKKDIKEIEHIEAIFKETLELLHRADLLEKNSA